VLVLHAAFCAIVVRGSLRVGSLPFAVRAARIAGWLCRTRASTGECDDAAAAESGRLAHATCLYRALTAYALIVHRHPDTQFHLGVLRAGDVATHAWVTIGGRPIDAEACRYVTLWTASD
jgi:hypothetical protein